MTKKELEELKTTLVAFISEAISKLTTGQSEMMKEILAFKEIVQEKDQKIEALEKRVDEMVQLARLDDVIISGLKVKPFSYARSVANSPGEDTPPDELATIERQVVDFFKSKEIVVDQDKISVCYILPSKDRKANPVILLRFANRKQKDQLLRQGRKLKGSDVYINEHLTKKNAEIAREARMLKKQKKIQGTWSKNGKVLVKPEGDSAKITWVRDLKELEHYQ